MTRFEVKGYILRLTVLGNTLRPHVTVSPSDLEMTIKARFPVG